MHARPWSRSGAIHGSTKATEAHAPAYKELGVRSRYREAPAGNKATLFQASRKVNVTSRPLANGSHQLDLCNRYRRHRKRNKNTHRKKNKQTKNKQAKKKKQIKKKHKKKTILLSCRPPGKITPATFASGSHQLEICNRYRKYRTSNNLRQFQDSK